MEIYIIPQILLLVHMWLNEPSLWINFCYNVLTELNMHCLFFYTTEPKRIILSDFPLVNYLPSSAICLHQNPYQMIKI